MVAIKQSRSGAIRRRLGHPVIDVDGHVQEVIPVLVDFVREVGGHEMADRFWADFPRNPVSGPKAPWYSMTHEERSLRRELPPGFWTKPTRNTRDRATAHLPKLLYERLDEMGIDFSILYPTSGLRFPATRHGETRQALCRAYNTYQAAMFREFSDRLAPVAVIPMYTPEEAVHELEYASRVLGLKAAMIPGYVVRRTQNPKGGFGQRWMDTYGIDSPYNYDPVWAKCVELGIPPASHGSTNGWGSRKSISSFTYNGIGNFGSMGEAVCKSLFMGGVTRRFPTLNVGFMEGGVAWAAELYAQLVFRWRKRNPKALLEHLDPDLLDLESLMGYFDQYGGDSMMRRRDEIRDLFALKEPRMENIDDWAACKIDREEDLRDLFEPHFYFGCEGEDPLAGMAFNSKANPLGARLRPVFGSDIGHWDVTEMSGVVEEAYESVEHGLMTEEDFRDFVFTNPVRMYGRMNPNVFKGTVVEAEAVKALAEGT